MATVTLTPDGEEYGGAPDDDLEPRSSLVPEAEQRFGRYRLCFELASGGMGKVFLARMEGPGGFEKFAAVKRIHAHLAERKGFVEMFLDEARLTSRIDHPNVCSILDFGEASGRYYIAMEYLFGEPFSRVLSASFRMNRQDPRRIGFAARILAEACEGLHAAHELRGNDGELLHVVHRDVSPHNIFVTYDGGVRVVDFGIARAADQLHETTTGSVKGKWAYMSPEQAKGKKLDRRADVWSLGVVLWEAVTGRRLFRRSTQTETVLAVVGLEVQPPSAVNPAVPSEIDEIALRALSRDVDERWASARAMGQALSHWLARVGEPVGKVEIAEWMDECFPGAADRKRELLASAREGSYPGGAADPFPDRSAVRPTPSDDAPTIDEGEDEPARLLPLQEHDPSVPTVPAKRLGGSPPPPSGLPLEPDEPEREALEPPAPPEPSAPRRRWGWAALVIVLGLIVPPLVLLRAEIVSLFEAEPASEPVSIAVAPAEGPAPDEPAEAPEPEPAPPSEEPPPEVEPSTTGPTDPSPLGDLLSGEEPAGDEAPEPRRRRPRRRARRAAPTATGSVVVVTTGGWALVYEGGRNLGETPASLTLPEGRHVLELRPFGQTPAIRRVVEVEPDGHHRVAVPVSRPE